MRNATLSSLVVTALAFGLGATGAQPQSTTDWSGFYAGIFGGYGLDAGAGSGSSIGPATLDIGGIILNGSLDNSTGRINGVFGGAAAGYNYQYNNLVLGLEANVGLGGLSKTESSKLALGVVNGANTVTIKYDQTATYDINWYTGVVGRLGLAHGSWLFSLKGGVVMADASIQATSRLTATDPGAVLGGLIGPGGINLPGAAHVNQILVGPTLGFGVETMIAENVSVGAEYTYISLPELSAPAAGIGNLLGGGGSTFTGAIHEVKASLNYHF